MIPQRNFPIGHKCTVQYTFLCPARESPVRKRGRKYMPPRGQGVQHHLQCNRHTAHMEAGEHAGSNLKICSPVLKWGRASLYTTLLSSDALFPSAYFWKQKQSMDCQLQRGFVSSCPALRVRALTQAKVCFLNYCHIVTGTLQMVWRQKPTSLKVFRHLATFEDLSWGPRPQGVCNLHSTSRQHTNTTWRGKERGRGNDKSQVAPILVAPWLHYI